ncbi:MAG: hypothetical protein HKO90_08075, partial [Flavobacteriaceae bacterium]|nr:hypothetical protein [Flavobacteriaceae bacterium]
PYIKEIAGRKRMFLLGTVSAVREDSGKFDGSATPDLALIDSEYRDVVWIDAKHPSQWDQKVYYQLNEAWRSSEGIGYYYAEGKDALDQQTISIDSIPVIPKVNKNQETIDRLQRQIDSLKAIGN